MGKVLVLSPHPDDDVIGCGGTIHQHIALGDRVEVLYLTSGENGDHTKSSMDTMRIREKEAVAAAEILQVSDIEFWREPDGKLGASKKNINRLMQKLMKYNPDVAYVTHMKEDHPDHQAASSMLILSLRKLQSGFKPVVWMYEVWTPIQKINRVVDISQYIHLKTQAIQAHQSQCAILRFDEAILGLNRYRGEMHSWPGGPYAEIFTAI